MNNKEKVPPGKKDTEKNEKAGLEPPRDKYSIIFILVFFIGLVHYLPTTFFSTATEFWMYKFRNTSIEETNSEFRTDLQAEYNAALRISQQVTNVAFMILTLVFGHFVTVRVRKVSTICVIMVLFLVLTAFVKIDTDSWQRGFFVMVIATTTVVNAANAVLMITMYTTFAFFPHKYLASYLLGVGLSQIFTAVMQVLSLTLGLSIENSALVYFLIGDTVVFFTLVALVLTGRSDFYVHYMAQVKDTSDNKITINDGIRLGKKIWPSMLMIGFSDLAKDASPTALVVSEGEGNGPWNDTYFIPTITYLVTAICLFTGRALGIKIRPNLSGVVWSLLAFSVFAIFSPLFMLCNAQPRSHLPVLLPHDYQYILLVIFFNLISGYLVSRSSYNIVNLVPKEDLKLAYHVNMMFCGVEIALCSFVNMVAVKLI